MFMNYQFTSYSTCFFTSDPLLDTFEGMEHWRSIFLHLLIETSKDFSLRSVQQIAGVGPPADALDVSGSLFKDIQVPVLNEIKEDNLVAGSSSSAAAGPPTNAPKLIRSNSSELRRANVMASAQAPPALVRMSSEEMVQRFQSMVSWEQSDHPIVIFKLKFDGTAEGVDMLSLNPQYSSQYIKGNLMQLLENMGINFHRDWSSISNNEAVDILRKIEGLDPR